jgi:hypothetical protein
MGWALEEVPGVHDIVEYESHLNYVLPQYDVATICTYDLPVPVSRLASAGPAWPVPMIIASNSGIRAAPSV